MISSTYVWVYLPNQTEPVVAGRLDYDDNPAGTIYSFLYGASYLNRRTAVPLDPERLPLERARRFDSSDLYGTLGAIRDASPDDWGRRVIEKRSGVTEASELTYLIEAGDDRAGALGFSESSDSPPNREPPPERTDLDTLLSAAAAIEEGQPVDPAVVMLLKHGSSLGGARPKATIHMDGELWLAKFPSTKDRLEDRGYRVRDLEARGPVRNRNARNQADRGRETEGDAHAPLRSRCDAKRIFPETFHERSHTTRAARGRSFKRQLSNTRRQHSETGARLPAGWRTAVPSNDFQHARQQRRRSSAEPRCHLG